MSAGAGTMVAAVCGSTQKEPVVVGKPSTFMMDFLLERYGPSTLAQPIEVYETEINLLVSTQCLHQLGMWLMTITCL